jgi:phosphopantetheine--protein transferase-like protein
MIKGIGVDILNINRIDFKIAKKVLSSEELEIFDSIDNEKLKREYLAERFAVKEALFKADNAYFNYDQISILNDEKGKPYFKDINGFVSIAHDNGMVCAFVVLNG